MSSSEEQPSSPRATQSYLYACQRAELLGLPTPTEAEWLASDEYAQEREAETQDAHDDAVAQELDHDDEKMRRVGGGLDELNSILNVTQKKINKFKNVCGSLGTLLKARVSSQPGTPDHKPRSGSGSEQPSTSEQTPTADEPAAGAENPDGEGAEAAAEPGDERQRPQAGPRKADLNAKVGSHIDKLDSLITKAENAQYSMKHQNKQMKAFLK